MNAKQLKELVLDLPDDMEIVTQGHEGRAETTRSVTSGEVVAVYAGYVTSVDIPGASVAFLIRGY